jgi:rSAM/selenodomain-associated transferase 2
VSTPPGRGRQLAAGAADARADWLWFLHADSAGTAPALDWLARHRDGPAWGRFDVRLEPAGPMLRLVGFLMNQRSRLTGICTGDQGIFVHRVLLERAGGMPEQPLMEDIELSRRLKRLGRPLCPRVALLTSSRRWRDRGAVRTIFGMWWFRLRYWLGADPERLARAYYR